METKTLNLIITVDGRTLEKNFALIENQVPEEIGELIQSTVDTLLDNEEVF